jgi:hypothetical protein
MADRPTGAGILAIVPIGYGAVTLLSFPIAFLRGFEAFPLPGVLLGVLLALLVGLLGIGSGVGVWRLAPWAPRSLLLLAASIVRFNAWVLWPLAELPGDVIIGLACGLAMGALCLVLLYRYLAKVCSAA